jgi:NtrC-family two-component system sensor histidine kinase KinB
MVNPGAALERSSGSKPASVRLSRGRSLGARLQRAIGVLSATLVALCALSAVAVTRLGGATGLILRENYASVVACQEMNEALERQGSAALFAATGHEELAYPALAANRSSFAQAFEGERKNITVPGEAELVRSVAALNRDYLTTLDAVLARPAETRTSAYFNELLPRFHALKRDVTKIRLLNQASMEAADVEARRLAHRTLELTVAATVAALVFALWFLRRVPRILEPLAAFADQARAIGEGKLDASVPAPEVPELRALAESLNRMQEKLRAYRESSLGELLAAKDLSRATIAAMTDPVIVFGSRGEVLLANDSAEAIFGLTSGDGDELRSAGVEVPEPLAAARNAVLTSGTAILPRSLSEAMKWIGEDQERYFLVRASPLLSDEGKRSAIVVAQDVTRFRRIDALKSDVVATVSHELKTPLTSLRLATHMLLEESTGSLNGVQRELAQTACDETERLQGTVDELLDIVRIEQEAGGLKPSHVEPLTLLREVASAYKTLAELKRVHVEIDASEAAASVELDSEQIVIVLGNLVSNAIRHSPEGGHILLSAQEQRDAHVFIVRDQGEGIAREHLQRIFQRRWSGADPAQLRGRHGLGLAIAREIAERHGGSLEVESEPGNGSTFRLRVPHELPQFSGMDPAHRFS